MKWHDRLNHVATLLSGAPGLGRMAGPEAMQNRVRQASRELRDGLYDMKKALPSRLIEGSGEGTVEVAQLLPGDSLVLQGSFMRADLERLGEQLALKGPEGLVVFNLKKEQSVRVLRGVDAETEIRALDVAIDEALYEERQAIAAWLVEQFMDGNNDELIDEIALGIEQATHARSREEG
jgi:hypothetical protein